jgi:GntR family transcriptional regulator/MocR family aminotransferase
VPEKQSIPGLDLHLDLTGGRRPGRVLEEALRAAVADGRLAPGTRLPPTRGLAADLGVSRATVAEVYEQLLAEGWLRARVGAGTWVAQSGVPVPAARAPQAGGPRLADMRGGVPDASLFPRRAWVAAVRRAVDAATVAELGYADPAGVVRLRHALAGYLARTRGVLAEADRIVVGHGVGELLALAGRALAARGARGIAVEEYGHSEHRAILRAAGLEPVALPVDGEGADVSRLAALGVDAVLLTASHQFPLGVPLGARRRRDVVAWADSVGGYVLEDDYDGEFRYDRRPVGTLQSLAPPRIVYLGTASKALSPAVGLAWAVLPDELVAGVLAERAGLSQPRDALNQLALAHLFEAHDYDRHVRRQRAEYRARRDHVTAGLARRVPGARLLGVAAGLQCTVELPMGVDAAAAVAAGAARGLLFLPLDAYAAPGAAPRRPAVVLGFGASLAVRALADADLAVDAIAAATEAADRELD